MRASPVRVDAGFKADVRAVVARDDGAGSVAQVDGIGGWPVVRGVRVELHRDPLEAVLGFARRPAAWDVSWSLSVPHL
jgi:hypothetical protein